MFLGLPQLKPPEKPMKVRPPINWNHECIKSIHISSQVYSSCATVVISVYHLMLYKRRNSWQPYDLAKVYIAFSINRHTILRRLILVALSTLAE